MRKKKDKNLNFKKNLDFNSHTSERSFDNEYLRTVHNCPKFDNALARYISSSVCLDALRNVFTNSDEYFVDISP